MILKDASMRGFVAVAALIVLSVPFSARADEMRACLSKAEQRAAIASGQAVTLASAIRSARLSIRGRGGREVVKAQLCRDAGGLRYVLTVLARDGKVTQATVDAKSGRLVDAR